MSIKNIKRPKLSWKDKVYLFALLKGISITLKHGIKSVLSRSRGADSLQSSGLGITMQYPETKWDDKLPEHYRGVPALVTDEEDRERCVSCQLCEFICPPKAIKITPGAIAEDEDFSKVEKRPEAFDIDMTRCIYCGMCEEVCPEQAIFLRKEYIVTGENRAAMVHDKKRLYEIGGKREGLVNKWNNLK